jgi:hypothetical protein
MQKTIGASEHARLVERLPITFRPFINEKLRDMEALFAFERASIETMLSFLEGLNQSEFESLFKPVRVVESKMGVEHWTFSIQGETLENTSLLAHSAYYQEWRQAVQGVFDEVSQRAQALVSQSAGRARRRLILIVLPKCLPVKIETVCGNWPGQGRFLRLAASDSGAATCSEILLAGDGARLLRHIANTERHTPEDLWILDAGSTLSKIGAESVSEGRSVSSTYLGYAELKTFREAFREQLNWVEKDLADADRVIATLRQTDVTPWCPDALKNRIATREFVKELFLSGNGAVVFGNAFVQWAANEAFRRARPRTLVACFGMRNKPKPFTSIAILEDQEQTSPLPNTPDPDGSAVDAQILASYVWLAASRYEEYKDALCLCVADAIPAIYAVAPAGQDLFREPEPVKLERIRQIVEEWMS